MSHIMPDCLDWLQNWESPVVDSLGSHMFMYFHVFSHFARSDPPQKKEPPPMSTKTMPYDFIPFP